MVDWLRCQPFLFHWGLVLVMGVIVPLLTIKTEKPGEYYPFSNFPMYSRFAPDTYYVYVTDLNDKPIAFGATFGTAISNAKKAYDRKLMNLKKESDTKDKRANLPMEMKRAAAEEVLKWLVESAPDQQLVRDYGGIRLHQVDIMYRDGRVTKSSSPVGELKFSNS